MKKIYEVTRRERSSEYVYIEAENEAEAEMIAENIDSHLWRQSQNYECEICRIQEVSREDVEGKYVETDVENYLINKQI